VRLLVAELAEVHDLAHGRPFLGRNLNQVELCLAGHVQGLAGWHNTQLLSGGPNESNRADADLFVDALLVLLVTVTITIKRGQIVSPVQKAEASSGQARA